MANRRTSNRAKHTRRSKEDMYVEFYDKLVEFIRKKHGIELIYTYRVASYKGWHSKDDKTIQSYYQVTTVGVPMADGETFTPNKYSTRYSTSDITSRLNEFLRKKRQTQTSSLDFNAKAKYGLFCQIDGKNLEKMARTPHKLLCSLVVPLALKNGLLIFVSSSSYVKVINENTSIEEALIHLDLNS